MFGIALALDRIRSLGMAEMNCEPCRENSLKSSYDVYFVPSFLSKTIVQPSSRANSIADL